MLLDKYLREILTPTTDEGEDEEALDATQKIALKAKLKTEGFTGLNYFLESQPWVPTQDTVFVCAKASEVFANKEEIRAVLHQIDKSVHFLHVNLLPSLLILQLYGFHEKLTVDEVCQRIKSWSTDPKFQTMRPVDMGKVYTFLQKKMKNVESFHGLFSSGEINAIWVPEARRNVKPHY